MWYTMRTHRSSHRLCQQIQHLIWLLVCAPAALLTCHLVGWFLVVQTHHCPRNQLTFGLTPAFAATQVDPREHPVGIIILSHSPPKGIRFTINREFFLNVSNYDDLPPRLLGEIDRWIDRDNGYKLKVLWPIDDSNTIQMLGQLLDPEYRIKLEPYEDNRSAPKAKGTTWRRLYAQMKATGPYANAILEDMQQNGDEREVTISYLEGSISLEQVWIHRPSGFVIEDWRPGNDRVRLKVKGLAANQVNEFEKFLFNACLPLSLARNCVGWFNERLDANSNDDSKKLTTVGEIVKFWGYLAAIALQPGHSVSQMWRRRSYAGDITPPPHMGRHGMHKNRFKRMQALHRHFYPKDEHGLNPLDPYRYCAAIVDSFNAERFQRFEPSHLLVGDESMSPFLGAEGVVDGVGQNPDPIPHRDFIERKPEPLGKELKTLADGMSGITLRFEIQLGADLHCRQPYYDDYGHSTAVSLRLLQPWFPKSNDISTPPLRAYYADSWFMGVDSAEAIHWESKKTIFPFGDVKTKTTRFPTEELKAACGPHSGDWSVMTTDVQLEDSSMMKTMAIGHRRGPEIHTFLSTCGLTIPGRPQAHKDDDLDFETGYLIARKCPSVLNDATQAQPRIDMTNKKRQYALALEKRFKTQSFPFRLFCTILGTCLVDAFYGWNYLNPERQLKWGEAIRRAAFAMMHNTLDKIATGLLDSDVIYQVPKHLKTTVAPPYQGNARDTAFSSQEDDASESEDDPGLLHLAVPFNEVPGLQCGKQNRCIVCAYKVTFCCGPCSMKHPALFFPIHQRASGKDCLERHSRDPSAYPAKIARGPCKKDEDEVDESPVSSKGHKRTGRHTPYTSRSSASMSTTTSKSTTPKLATSKSTTSKPKAPKPRTRRVISTSSGSGSEEPEILKPSMVSRRRSKRGRKELASISDESSEGSSYVPSRGSSDGSDLSENSALSEHMQSMSLSSEVDIDMD